MYSLVRHGSCIPYMILCNIKTKVLRSYVYQLHQRVLWQKNIILDDFQMQFPWTKFISKTIMPIQSKSNHINKDLHDDPQVNQKVDIIEKDNNLSRGYKIPVHSTFTAITLNVIA